ncbi:AMP-binding protein [Alcaligenaceae bacterium]|nr:AMP-binding protein [Alcaligenaceae bacterium]
MMDKRLPDRRDCIIRELIDRRAQETPDKPFVLFSPDEGWTYGTLREKVRSWAAAFQAQGVKQGDMVVCWLPNGKTLLRAMLALNYIGAVYVPVNIGYRGALLAHVIANSGGRLLVTHASLVDRLDGLALGQLRKAIVFGGEHSAPAGLETVAGEVMDAAGETPAALQTPLQPWDTLTVIYTSGTTGPSKGVLMSSLQVYANYIPNGQATAQDRTLITLPMFHVAGAGAVWSALMRGGSVAVTESFKTHRFWDTVRAFQVTHTTLLGVMMSFLLKEPPSDRDRDHTLRRAMSVPLSNQHADFTARFGVDIYTGYNMTEISTPLFVGPNPAKLGTCGRLRPGIEARIVDENDCELPDGETGELILRADMPYAMSHGYHGDAQATARAWRNGWFHTGDALRRDADGDYYFVDRIKDAIRRRGENVSSFEVEKELLAHPAVRDAAVVGVPSEHGEDEILAVLCLVPGQSLDFVALVEFLQPRMAHFMVPRYFKVVEDLPRTPTNKVIKQRIREEGMDAQCWDRETAGLRLRRDASIPR